MSESLDSTKIVDSSKSQDLKADQVGIKKLNRDLVAKCLSDYELHDLLPMKYNLNPSKIYTSNDDFNQICSLFEMVVNLSPVLDESLNLEFEARLGNFVKVQVKNTLILI